MVKSPPSPSRKTLAVSFDDHTTLTENTKQTDMKTTKYFLLTLFIVLTKFGQAQTLVDTMTVYPNPFDNVATIHFEIANTDTVSLTLFNLNGQTVQTFFTNTILPSGSYSINLFGGSLANGLYIVRLQYAFDKSITKKIAKIGSSTSIHDPTADNEKIILYPNPTSDLLTIPIDGQKTILITNLNGQILKTVKTYDKTISLSDLATDNYLISIFNQDNKLLTTCKIVKAK